MVRERAGAETAKEIPLRLKRIAMLYIVTGGLILLLPLAEVIFNMVSSLMHEPGSVFVSMTLLIALALVLIVPLLLLIALGILCIFVGLGLLKARRWSFITAKVLTILGFVFFLVFVLFCFFIVYTSSKLSALFVLAAGVVILIVLGWVGRGLCLQESKQFFDRRVLEATQIGQSPTHIFYM
jgi:hypothetical protein